MTSINDPYALPREVSSLFPAKTLLRLKNTYQLYDRTGDGVVDMREVGTIIRSLGFAPTEAQVSKIVLDAQGDEPSNYVAYNRFVPALAKTVRAGEIERIRPSDLLRAFQVIDADRRGAVSFAELQDLLTTCCEKFTADEISEMQQFCGGAEGDINYATYFSYFSTDFGPY